MGEKIEKAAFESYSAVLKEPGRPPSRGGNTKAWHRHQIRIAGEPYSFLAAGAQKWAFVGDLVSFEWEWDKTKTYRNVVRETFVAYDKAGKLIRRGNRDTSKTWRTAQARLPASRREQRD